MGKFDSPKLGSPILLLLLPCNIPHDNPQQNTALLYRNQVVSLWEPPQNLSLQNRQPYMVDKTSF